MTFSDQTLTQPELATPVALPATVDRIVLTGFMGAGKTTVGRLLAQHLGWAFLDLDAHLEARTASTIPNLFSLHGEPAFRRLESSALANALAHPRTVLALGGGTPEQLTNRLLLEQTPATLVIYLEAPFSTLFDRCMLQTIAAPGHIRPLLSSPDQARARFEARQPLYRRLARITLPTEGFSPGQLAQTLLKQIAETHGTRIQRSNVIPTGN